MPPCKLLTSIIAQQFTMSELPLTTTLAPNTTAELAALVREAYASKTPIYPLGGETSLHFGVPVKTPGTGISLGKLNRIVDYPFRDLTITVAAGIPMSELTATLARERQQLPVDVPQANQATLGGVLATNWNGPRRFGYGPLRDYVIGISAVDGRGMEFHGGGRVVKNVAGYDFCKLLTGSFGALGIITQVTLKVRPVPESVRTVAVVLNHEAEANQWLERLAQASITPVAIELASGPAWCQMFSLPPQAYVGLLRLEGTATEVEWMLRELEREQRALQLRELALPSVDDVWLQFIEWSATGNAPLVLRANVRPSQVLPFMRTVREIDGKCDFLAQAGNGVVDVKFSTFPADGLSRTLVGKLQPLAAAQGGHIVLLANPSGAEMTRQCVWGGSEGSLTLMQALKQKFDPAGILNPGRFVVG